MSNTTESLELFDDRVQCLQEELDLSRLELDKAKETLSAKDEEIKRKNHELGDMSNKLKVKQDGETWRLALWLNYG